MRPYEKFLHDRVGLRHLLEVYLELRQHFQEIGFSESDLEQPPTYTDKMMMLFHKFGDTQKALFKQVNDYGFDVEWIEFGNFITLPDLEVLTFKNSIIFDDKSLIFGYKVTELLFPKKRLIESLMSKGFKLC